MRSARALALSLVTAFLVATCGGATPSTSPTASAAAKAVCTAKNVKVAVPVTPPNVVHLTPYVATDFGYFKDENLTVELIRFEGGVGSLRASASIRGIRHSHRHREN